MKSLYKPFNSIYSPLVHYFFPFFLFLRMKNLVLYSHVRERGCLLSQTHPFSDRKQLLKIKPKNTHIHTHPHIIVKLTFNLIHYFFLCFRDASLLESLLCVILQAMPGCHDNSRVFFRMKSHQKLDENLA